MYIENKIKHPCPLKALKTDPYSLGIFNKEVDFILEPLEYNEVDKCLILAKKINGIISYIFIFEVELLDEENLDLIYKNFTTFVLKLREGNFREAELLIICKEISPSAKEIISTYNQTYIYRPPITIVINEHS
jgi:hypothetical protein